jgi:hypothetical protein
LPRKAAKIGGSTGITSSARSAIEKLPSYKRTFVKARAEGKTIRASAAEAGYGAPAGSRWEKEQDVQKAYRELMQKAIPAEKLVRLIKGGCEAKMPMFDAKGKKVSERADWKTRRPYIEMASEQAGYFERKNAAGSGGTAITFVVNHIGQGTKTVKTIEASTSNDEPLVING